MALFERPDTLEEPMDPAEERKLIRKIDFIILPYLAVCYAFFYIGQHHSLLPRETLWLTLRRQDYTILCGHIWDSRRSELVG